MIDWSDSSERKCDPIQAFKIATEFHHLKQDASICRYQNEELRPIHNKSLISSEYLRFKMKISTRSISRKHLWMILGRSFMLRAPCNADSALVASMVSYKYTRQPRECILRPETLADYTFQDWAPKSPLRKVIELVDLCQFFGMQNAFFCRHWRWRSTMMNST